MTTTDSPVAPIFFKVQPIDAELNDEQFLEEETFSRVRAICVFRKKLRKCFGSERITLIQRPLQIHLQHQSFSMFNQSTQNLRTNISEKGDFFCLMHPSRVICKILRTCFRSKKNYVDSKTSTNSPVQPVLLRIRTLDSERNDKHF